MTRRESGSLTRAAAGDGLDERRRADQAIDLWSARGERQVRGRFTRDQNAVAGGPAMGEHVERLKTGADQRQCDERRNHPHRMRVAFEAGGVSRAGHAGLWRTLLSGSTSFNRFESMDLVLAARRRQEIYCERDEVPEMGISKGWLQRTELVLTVAALVVVLVAYVISKLSGS